MEDKKVLTASPVGEAVILNEETAKSLAAMLKSNDEADHKMAQLILNTCDIEKSIYWIWQLARYYSNRMVNLRTKASRTFRDHSRLFFISQKGQRAFAEFLANQGWLTPDIYQKLENDILKATKLQCNNKFYDVTLKIKDEYKHLTPNVEPIKCNYND